MQQTKILGIGDEVFVLIKCIRSNENIRVQLIVEFLNHLNEERIVNFCCLLGLRRALAIWAA